MAHQGQTGRTNTGTDPAYVPDREIFDAYTHQQIWDLAHEKLAPAELRRLADAWGLAASVLESAFDDHAREITRLSGEWSGIAAATAARAAAALVQAGDDSVAVCRVLQQLMTADSGAAESVRAAIPPPPAPYRPDPDPAVEAATGAQRRMAYNTAVAAAAAAAQDAMTFGYNPTIPASGDAVPRFPTAVEGADTAGVSGVPGTHAGAAAPGTESAPAVGASPGDGDTAPATPGVAPPSEDTAPDPESGRPGTHPQPLIGTDSAPYPQPPVQESQQGGPPREVPSQAVPPADGSGTPTDAAGAPEEEPTRPENAPEAGPPPPEGTAPADTTSAGTGPAPAAHPAGADPAGRTAAPPSVERGTVFAGGPGIADPAPRPPGAAVGGPAVTGTGPANPAPPLSPSPPGGSSGAAGHSHHGPVSGPSGAAPAPGSATGYRPGSAVLPPAPAGPGISAPAGPGAPAPTGPASAPAGPEPTGPGGPVRTGSGAPIPFGPDTPGSIGPDTPVPLGPNAPGAVEPDAPGAVEPDSSGHCQGGPGRTGAATPSPADPGNSTPTAQGPAGPGTSSPIGSGPDSIARAPGGSPEPARPPVPGYREPFVAAGTESDPSPGTAGTEHPGARPFRLVPAGIPLAGAGGSPPLRPADDERSSPDYLQAPNEDLTATPPSVPPVLGEYTEAERAERADPGGGSH
ncbi:hypothetical protein [Nocardia sp. NPDC051750]|uniref:hypothetical protein n=1 Tax=Nocardia sp. NPDC051750 TaxID=3364325 RepID=UPI0037AFEE75